MRAIVLAAAIAGTAGAALAQELPDRREANRMIFAPGGQMQAEVIPHESLNAAEIAILERALRDGLMPAMAYYGALAIAPDAGLANAGTTAAVGNLHDEAGARAAALAQCEAGRGEEGAPCVVVLVIRPEGWEPGAQLQLSARATEALRGEFRQTPRPRVMSISPATGQFGIGADAGAANAACGAEDCRAVVADP